MNGIYQTFFTLINNYIFGGITLEVTSYEHMICVIGATILCALCVYVPFAVVRWFFRGLGGVLR